MTYPLFFMIPLQRNSVWYLTVQWTSERDEIIVFNASVGKIFWGSLWVNSWMLFSRVKVTSSGGTTQQLSRLICMASGLILAELWSSTNAEVSTSLIPREWACSWSTTLSMAFHKALPSSRVIPAGHEIKNRSALMAPSSWRATMFLRYTNNSCNVKMLLRKYLNLRHSWYILA